MSECPKGKIRNPKTGRCIKIDGPTAKSYIETVQKSLRSYRNKKYMNNVCHNYSH